MLDVLFEDNHCLVVNKPAGLLSQGDATGERTLLDEARDYLKLKYDKPGNVYIGLVHRLDRPTSGLVLLARTSKSAARLSQQFRDGGIEKTYLAVVDGACGADEGEWTDTLLKDDWKNIVSIVPEGTPGGRVGSLAYRVIDRTPGRSLIEVRPLTGRSHQIRVQLAGHGLPIAGDKKYGARSTVPAADGRPRVALHAASMTFTHPTLKEAISVNAPTPGDWPWRPVPGSPTAPPTG